MLINNNKKIVYKKKKDNQYKLKKILKNNKL